jgi:hypothetical protein
LAVHDDGWVGVKAVAEVARRREIAMVSLMVLLFSLPLLVRCLLCGFAVVGAASIGLWWCVRACSVFPWSVVCGLWSVVPKSGGKTEDEGLAIDFDRFLSNSLKRKYGYKPNRIQNLQSRSSW